MEHVNHDDRIVDRYHAKMTLKLQNMLPVGWQARMMVIPRHFWSRETTLAEQLRWGGWHALS